MNHLRIHNHPVIRSKRKWKSCDTNLWKNTLPKEDIKTQRVTNSPHFNSQSEPPAPKEIMVNPRMQTDVLFYP